MWEFILHTLSTGLGVTLGLMLMAVLENWLDPEDD